MRYLSLMIFVLLSACTGTPAWLNGLSESEAGNYLKKLSTEELCVKRDSTLKTQTIALKRVEQELATRTDGVLNCMAGFKDCTTLGYARNSTDFRNCLKDFELAKTRRESSTLIPTNCVGTSIGQSMISTRCY